MATIKKRIIDCINAFSDTVTLKDVEQEVTKAMQENGLQAHNGELVPGFEGAWKSTQKMVIYKSETNSNFWGFESLTVSVSRYGKGDKAMYYSIDALDLSQLTKEQGRDARIWADLNDGIVGKEYQ